ncbi:MAG: hypothetical protein ACK4TB_03450 [Gemmobacter sp.]
MGQGKTGRAPVATSATSATRAAEWGIPDWRDPAAYGDAERWTLGRWRWEFRRRRDDYRNETLAILALSDEVAFAGERMKTDAAPDARCAWLALSAQAEKLLGLHWRKWGYRAPLDPRVSEYPPDDLLLWPHGGVRFMRGSPDGRAPEKRNRLVPAPHELAVRVNLDRPLAEQLTAVEGAAKRGQMERHGRLLQTRRHETKWRGYLRALDARESGASWAEIATLFPNTAKSEQTARDIWTAANDLRFNF